MIFFKEGKKLYYAGENERALDLFMKSKEPNAYFYCGLILSYDKLYKDAMFWFEKGAELEDTCCDSEIGRMYLLGLGVELDEDKALHYLYKAFNKGNNSAKIMLGIHFFDKKLYKEAIPYFECSDYNDFPQAAFYLSKIYFNGLGLEKDSSLGVYYLEIAAIFDDINAYGELGHRFLHGDGVEIDEQKALQYFLKVSDTDHPTANIEIADIYKFGLGVEVDEEKAFMYYNKSHPHSLALYYVGQCYQLGIGVMINYNKANEYYLQGTKIEDMYGIETLNYQALAFNYRFGLGFDIDIEKAIEYFHKECSGSSYYCIGEIYLNGENTSIDYKKAFEYFERALECGNKSSYEKLAVMYENGYYVEKNIELANEYIVLFEENK